MSRKPWGAYAWLAASLTLCPGALAQSAGVAQTAQIKALGADGQEQDASLVRASLSRTLPPELGAIPGPDRDALRFLVISPLTRAAEKVQVATFDAAGHPLDVLADFPTEPAACPGEISLEVTCRRTMPVRLVGDAFERQHPLLKPRTLRAELGGTLRLLSSGGTLELAITGPRLSNGERIERLRASLRVLVLRSSPGGALAVGSDAADAERRMSQELATAGGLWAQCGLAFVGSNKGEGSRPPAIQVVDPPASVLATVGCGLGQPASGGTLQLRRGTRHVKLTTRPGERPLEVALRLAAALGPKAPPVSENHRVAAEPLPTADLLLREGDWQRDGDAPLSTDPSLPLCLTRVDLSDGLRHFSDGDAFTGTLEERALLRAFDDGDPRTIEVLVVPDFERGERLGESFIVGRDSSLSSSVIIDRSSVLVGARSFALAHELGHVLLAMPGHPDDFGVDQSWSLLDADVADPTIFGPRRLSLDDCERMLREAGPRALVPLLEPWPPSKATAGKPTASKAGR